MAKKSFKNSARESVASAFFGSVEVEPNDEEKTETDTVNTEHTLDTKSVSSVEDAEDVQNTRDTKKVQGVSNIQDTAKLKSKNKQEETGDYRINLKLKGEFKEYLSDVAWENRTSITNYLNDLIEKDMKTKQGRN